MYDSVTFRIDNPQNDRVLGLLANTRFMTDSSGTPRVCLGNIGNLRVSINDAGMSIAGSLAKYHLGNNLESLSLQTTREAVEHLSEHLGVDLGQARITSLEFGAGIQVSKPVASYLVALGSARYYERLHYQNGGLVYRNGTRSLAFYDKAKETKRHKGSIPSKFEKTHILRYEIRFKNRLAKQLKTPQISGSSLYDKRFFSNLINRWGLEYFNINRINTIRFDVAVLADVRHFTRGLASLGMATIGASEVLSMIEEQRDSFSKIQYSRLRTKTAELSGSSDLVEPNSAILELDDKVNTVIQAYR